MMILLLGGAGVIIVAASFLSRNAFKKRMVELRAKEDAHRDKVSRFRAQEADALEEDEGVTTVDVGGYKVRVVGIHGRLKHLAEHFSHFDSPRDPSVNYWLVTPEGAHEQMTVPDAPRIRTGPRQPSRPKPPKPATK